MQSLTRHPRAELLGGDFITELRKVEGRGPFYKLPMVEGPMTMEH